MARNRFSNTATSIPFGLHVIIIVFLVFKRILILTLRDIASSRAFPVNGIEVKSGGVKERGYFVRRAYANYHNKERKVSFRGIQSQAIGNLLPPLFIYFYYYYFFMFIYEYKYIYIRIRACVFVCIIKRNYILDDKKGGVGSERGEKKRTKKVSIWMRGAISAAYTLHAHTPLRRRRRCRSVVILY